MEKLIAFRDWLGRQIEGHSGKVTGSGAFMGATVADLSIELEGEKYNITIRRELSSGEYSFPEALLQQQEAAQQALAAQRAANDSNVVPLLTPFNSNPNR